MNKCIDCNNCKKVEGQTYACFLDYQTKKVYVEVHPLQKACCGFEEKNNSPAFFKTDRLY